MDMANFVSYKLGFAENEFYSEANQLLRNFWGDDEIKHKMTTLLSNYLNDLVEGLKKDKKNTGENLTLILSKGFGKMFKTEVASDEKFMDILKEYAELTLKGL